MKRIFPLTASACLLALLGSLAPAHAAFVTFVTPQGNDGFDCEAPATACREISAAIGKTDVGGTISVEPGEYGGFTVNQSVNIVADSGRAIVSGNVPNLLSAAIGITASGSVLIRGLMANNGAHGVVVAGPGSVSVVLEDCTLLSWNGRSAINFQPIGPSELLVSNSLITSGDSLGAGILIKPGTGASAQVVLDNVQVDNVFAGIFIDGRASLDRNRATIRNSTISDSDSFGLRVTDDAGGGTTEVLVEGSTIANNRGFAVGADGIAATVRMRDSTVTGTYAGNGLFTLGGGRIISQGGNTVAGNSVDGMFTSSSPLQ